MLCPQYVKPRPPWRGFVMSKGDTMFDPGRPVSPTEIYQWFGLPSPQAIYMWAQRGLITPADHDGRRGGARYWISDLRGAEKATRENRKSSRGRQYELVAA